MWRKPKRPAQSCLEAALAANGLRQRDQSRVPTFCVTRLAVVAAVMAGSSEFP